MATSVSATFQHGSHPPHGDEALIERKLRVEAKDIFASPHPATLRLFSRLSAGYWLLTGPLPLLWLLITSHGSLDVFWSVATKLPHLYLHSTCVGLFLAMCLRYPLAAMLASEAFRTTTFNTLLALLPMTLIAIFYEYRSAHEIYDNDPSHIVLPLSSALQMFIFMLAAAIVILIGLGISTHKSQRTADLKVSNRLFGAILFGLLWLPMRNAYETQTPATAREFLNANSHFRSGIIFFVFILAETVLAHGVFSKQRRYLIPIVVMISSISLLLISLLIPSICLALFRANVEPWIYICIFGTSLVFYRGMTLYESNNN